MTGTKEKQRPHNSWVKQGSIPLLLALMVCVALALGVHLALQLPYANSKPLFFPFFVMLFYPPLPSLLFIGVIITFIGGLIAAYRLSARKTLVALTLVMGLACFFQSGNTILTSYIPTVRQNLIDQNKIYYLLSMFGLDGTRGYVIIECDETILMCQHYSTSYWIIDSWHEIKDFNELGSLVMNPTDHKIYLHMSKSVFENREGPPIYDPRYETNSTQQ
jgi:hypothetical protein